MRTETTIIYIYKYIYIASFFTQNFWRITKYIEPVESQPHRCNTQFCCNWYKHERNVQREQARQDERKLHYSGYHYVLFIAGLRLYMLIRDTWQVLWSWYQRLHLTKVESTTFFLSN